MNHDEHIYRLRERAIRDKRESPDWNDADTFEAGAAALARESRVLAVLNLVEWDKCGTADDPWDVCNCCNSVMQEDGHADDCKLAALLAEIKTHQ